MAGHLVRVAAVRNGSGASTTTDRERCCRGAPHRPSMQMGPTRRSTPLSPARGSRRILGAQCRCLPSPVEDRFGRALSPALAPASGSVRRSVRIRRSFPVPPGGSETGLPLASRLERLHRSGRSLRDASSASDRRNRPMVASGWRSSRTISSLPAEALCKAISKTALTVAATPRWSGNLELSNR
jgi:hypothetical protein